jgi:hypothetical protein
MSKGEFMKNSEKRFEVCINFLLVTSGVIAIFGFVIAVLKDTILETLLSQLFDPVFWQGEIVSEGTTNFEYFVVSLLGALMFAWGILIFGIIKNALKKREKWAWNTLVFSTLAWFLVDESFSVRYAVWANVYGNIVLLLMLLVPLFLIRKEVNNGDANLG